MKTTTSDNIKIFAIFGMGALFFIAALLIMIFDSSNKMECKDICVPYNSKMIDSDCYCLNDEKHWVPNEE